MDHCALHGMCCVRLSIWLREYARTSKGYKISCKRFKKHSWPSPLTPPLEIFFHIPSHSLAVSKKNTEQLILDSPIGFWKSVLFKLRYWRSGGKRQGGCLLVTPVTPPINWYQAMEYRQTLGQWSTALINAHNCGTSGQMSHVTMIPVPRPVWPWAMWQQRPSVASLQAQFTLPTAMYSVLCSMWEGNWN